MFRPLISCWPLGSCGTIRNLSRPRSGDTPSCWCTTGHRLPYAPQACSTIERSLNGLSMLGVKSPSGAISGIDPGISHTWGSSWMRALPVV